MDETADRPPAPERPAPHRNLIVNLLGQVSFGLLAMMICLPSMQEWGQLFGSSQAAVQLTFSAYLVGFGAVQLLYGPLSDQYGRRRMLMIGLFVAGLGSLLAALAPTLDLLIAARFVQGAGAGAGMVVGRAMVQDLFAVSERTRVMAYIGMTMGLTPPLSTVIGGQLHVWLGWQANFVLMAGLAALLFVAAWRGLPPRRGPRPSQQHLLATMGRSYLRLTQEPVFLAYAAVMSLTTGVFYVFLAGAPTVLASYGIGPAGVGWFILCVPLAYVTGNFMTSRLVRVLRERQLMITGQGLSLCGITILLALGLAGVHSPFAFSLPLMLLGLGHGLLMPPTLAGSVGAVPALAGAAAAVGGVLQQFMGAFGGFVVGLFEHHGAVNLGWILLVFTMICIVATWHLFRSQARHPRSAPTDSG